jgi:hypothetical protein
MARVRYSLLLILLAVGLLGLGLRQPVIGVWVLPLPGRCQVELYSPAQQGVWTGVWACPGQEMTRFWPLPVQRPWYEQPLHPPFTPAGPQRL